MPQTQISKEGDIFRIPTEIAKLSNLVVTTLGEEEHDRDDDDDENTVEIPLSNVKSNVLSKVVEYCTHYNEDPSELLSFDAYIYLFMRG
jgi:S-phase kinase-associated protein 1